MSPAGKAALRLAARARRDALGRDEAQARSSRAAQNAIRSQVIGEGPVVAGYIAIASELDPAPLLAALARAGRQLCLPVVLQKGAVLGFRRYRPGDPLAPGPHGTRAPLPEAGPARPDVIFAPLLAFDRRGHRLGYGGGYYDRTFAALRAQGSVRAVGLAFACQELDAVPNEPGDAALDYIVTEDDVISCGGSA